MNTLETDIEIAADGSMRLLSPLPSWLKPGRAHVVLTVADAAGSKPKRQIPQATPEMIARRMAAFEELRRLDPYRDSADPMERPDAIPEESERTGKPGDAAATLESLAQVRQRAGLQRRQLPPEELERRKQAALQALTELRGSNPYLDLADPVAWQREMRMDRPLPFRN
jgi:hypothetical protein